MFLGISYGPLLALVLHSYIGPAIGLAVVHLATAWAAGHVGYAFAVYRLEVGSEQAVIVADFLTALSAGRRKKEKENEITGHIYVSFMISMVTLSLALFFWFVSSQTCRKSTKGKSFLL